MTIQYLKRHIGGLIVATLFIVLTMQSVSAQTPRSCGPREKVVETLADKYGESRQSVGLGANNSLIETYASSTTGSWTITSTNANGLTCLVASGQSFEALAEALPVKENDA